MEVIESAIDDIVSTILLDDPNPACRVSQNDSFVVAETVVPPAIILFFDIKSIKKYHSEIIPLMKDAIMSSPSIR